VGGRTGEASAREDRRRIAQSIEESSDELNEVIQEWARVTSLEQFFKRVETHARDLPEDHRQEVLKRLALAREFVGTQDPMDFFCSWKTPVERYVPLAMRTPGSEGEREGKEEEEGCKSTHNPAPSIASSASEAGLLRDSFPQIVGDEIRAAVMLTFPGGIGWNGIAMERPAASRARVGPVSLCTKIPECLRRETAYLANRRETA
jgi:hypothetical protein